MSEDMKGLITLVVFVVIPFGFLLYWLLSAIFKSIDDTCGGPVRSEFCGTCEMRTDEGVEKHFAPDDRFGSRNVWPITEDDRHKMRLIGWSEYKISKAVCYKVEKL